MRHQLSGWSSTVTVFFLLFVYAVLPETVRAQWTASGNNISNTNTGNVGVGTATPAAKLDVLGSANFSGDTTVAGRGTFSIDNSNNLNLSMYNMFKINAAGVIVNGAFETFDNYFGMRFTPANVLTVRIPASGSAYFNQGNVGINITAPVGLFNVTGDGTNPLNASSYHTLVNAQQSTIGGGQTHHSIFGVFSLAHDNNTGSGVYGHVVANPGENYSTGNIAGVRGYAAAPAYTTFNNTFSTYGGHFVAENPNQVGHGNTHLIYGIYAKAGSSYGTAAENQYAGYFENTITAGNVAFGLFQATAGAKNYFAGSVGIGTTAPAYKLDVNGEINATGLRINGTPVGSSGSSQWSTSGSSVYYNAGNIGVGTTSPTTRLHVLSNNANVLVGDISSGYGAIGFQSTLNVNNYALTGGATETVLNTPAGTALKLRVNNSLTSTLVLDSTGYVGIGANAPAYKLDVNGEINATGLRINGTPIGSGTPSQWTTSGSSVYYNTGNIGVGTTSPSTAKLVVSGNAGAEGLDLASTDQYANLRVIRNSLSGFDKDLYLQYQAGAASKMHFYSNNLESMTLSGGNLGIGTATPYGKLDVMGTSGAPNFANGLTGVLRVGASNEHIEFGYVTGNRNWIQSFGAVPLYINEGGNNVILNSSGGNVGVGTTSPTTKLHVVGDATVTGTLTGGTINAKYQDVAEWVESSQKLEAGTVVALDPERSNQVLASSEAYDTKVAGVISARPGIALGEQGEGKVLVATTGRVKVKVDATRAAIKIGDLLVTSEVAGVAMKSEPVSIGGRKMHSPGTLIGKALEPLAKGTGEILVLLSLQ